MQLYFWNLIELQIIYMTCQRFFILTGGLGNQNKTMRIIVDDKNITLSRLVLVKTVSDIIKKSLKILKINCPESM